MVVVVVSMVKVSSDGLDCFPGRINKLQPHTLSSFVANKAVYCEWGRVYSIQEIEQ